MFYCYQCCSHVPPSCSKRSSDKGLTKTIPKIWLKKFNDSYNIKSNYFRAKIRS